MVSLESTAKAVVGSYCLLFGPLLLLLDASASTTSGAFPSESMGLGKRVDFAKPPEEMILAAMLSKLFLLSTPSVALNETFRLFELRGPLLALTGNDKSMIDSSRLMLKAL